VLEVVDDKVRCKENPNQWIIHDKSSSDDSHPISMPSRRLHAGAADSMIANMSPTSTTSEECAGPPTRRARHRSAELPATANTCAREEVSDEVIAHSELWKWVDTPGFVPGKPFSPKSEAASVEDEKSSSKGV